MGETLTVQDDGSHVGVMGKCTPVSRINLHTIAGR